MSRAIVVIVLVLGVIFLAGCAAGPNEMSKTADADGTVAGFWRGLWHGIIAPITFIISLFTSNVQFYEVHNNGNWYNLGFVLGAGMLGGGGIFGSRRRHRDD